MLLFFGEITNCQFFNLFHNVFKKEYIYKFRFFFEKSFKNIFYNLTVIQSIIHNSKIYKKHFYNFFLSYALTMSYFTTDYILVGVTPF